MLSYYHFFAARCYASAALAVTRCSSVCLPVCLSRSYMHSVKTSKHIFKFFSPSGSHTILIFPYQTSQQYSDRNPPPNGSVECTWVDRSWESDPIYGLIACCERCDGQLLSTRLSADTRLSIDACWSQCYQLTVVRPWRGVTVQVCLWHIKPRTSECAEEKKRKHNLIYAAVNLTPEYNRKLRLTFCTIEANY